MYKLELKETMLKLIIEDGEGFLPLNFTTENLMRKY